MQVIDNEHGLGGEAALVAQLQATKQDVRAIVRTNGGDPRQILRASEPRVTSGQNRLPLRGPSGFLAWVGEYSVDAHISPLVVCAPAARLWTRVRMASWCLG
jgi:hypothetical protein